MVNYSIQLISRNRTTTCHFKSLNRKKNLTCVDGNPGPGWDIHKNVARLIG